MATDKNTIFGLYGCDADEHFLDEFYKSPLYSAIEKDPNCLILEICAGADIERLNGRRLHLATEDEYRKLSVKTLKFIQYCCLNFSPPQIIKFDVTCMRRSFDGPAFAGRKPLNLDELERFIDLQLASPLRAGNSKRLEAHYTGFVFRGSPRFANIENWGRKKGGVTFPRHVFASESDIPNYYQGKCYAISEDLAAFIASEGHSIAHQHKKLLHGSEDLMIARLANKFCGINSLGNGEKAKAIR